MTKFLSNFIMAFRLMGFHSNRVEFYQDLARSLEKKELLRAFLSAELEIAKARGTKDPSKAFALESTLKLVRDGEDVSALTKTIGRFMPKGDLMLLSAVDEAKNEDKPQTLRDLVAAIQEQALAKSVIRSALFVPVLMLPIVAAFVYVISTKLLPIVERIAPKEVWTTFNQAVRTFAHGAHDSGVYLLAAAFVFGMFFIHALPNWRGNLRYKMERIDPRLAVWLTPVAPWLLPLSIYRDFQAGMALTALAVFLKTGRSLKLSIETIQENSSPYMRRHLQRILDHLDDYPTQYAEAFSKGLLSPRLLARLSSLIRNERQFDKVIIEVGTTGNVEIRNQVKKSSTKLNFMFLIIASATVVFLYIGQVSITQSMQDEMDPVKRKQRQMIEQVQSGGAQS